MIGVSKEKTFCDFVSNEYLNAMGEAAIKSEYVSAKTGINGDEIKRLLSDLATKKPVFCSEMDFQLHLAWEMKARGWEVSLEFDPQCFDANAAIDILIHKPERIAIELKYKTTHFEYSVHGHSLRLKDQAARDVARYDFVKDVWRIERVVSGAQADRGFAIFLTNDAGYWRTGRDGTADAMFHMFDGRSIGGAELRWGPKASDGTKKGREKAILLSRDYVFGWQDYFKLDGKGGHFRYLLVEVALNGQNHL